MTAIVSVCEKWAIRLEEPAPDHEEWFADWILKAPHKRAPTLTAAWHVYHSLASLVPPDEVNTVVEYFGGVGGHALIIEDVYAPRYHRVSEYSREAVEHLERTFDSQPSISVHLADAYVPSQDWEGSPDLVSLDFGDLTAWKTREGEPHRALLDRVFAKEPKAVVFTDVAARYMHLHRSRYESLLGPGTCESYGSYLRAFTDRLRALYGYRLATGRYRQRWSSVWALVPEETLPPNPGLLGWRETPDLPVGLEVF